MFTTIPPGFNNALGTSWPNLSRLCLVQDNNLTQQKQSNIWHDGWRDEKLLTASVKVK